MLISWEGDAVYGFPSNKKGLHKPSARLCAADVVFKIAMAAEAGL